jgi:hypothetical protein
MLTTISEQPVDDVDSGDAWKKFCGGLNFEQVSGESLKLQYTVNASKGAAIALYVLTNRMHACARTAQLFSQLCDYCALL